MSEYKKKLLVIRRAGETTRPRGFSTSEKSVETHKTEGKKRKEGGEAVFNFMPLPLFISRPKEGETGSSFRHQKVHKTGREKSQQFFPTAF